MRRENLGNAIGVAIILALFLYASWLVPFTLQQYGGLLIATLLYAILGLVALEISEDGHERVVLTAKGHEAYRKLVQWINEVVHGGMPSE